MSIASTIAELRIALSGVKSAHETAVKSGDAVPRPGTPLAIALANIVDVAKRLDEPAWSELRADDPALLESRHWLAPLHGRAIFEEEVRSAAALTKEGETAGRLPVDAMNAWGRKAYDRVEDLFESVDLSPCQRFVLVGSGPLPVTLLHVHERTSIPELIAVDSNASAMESLARLKQRFSLTRFIPRHSNGLEVDFTSADVVYLANLLSPKRAILERAASQVKAGTVVIVREPVLAGELFAESATNPPPPGFVKFGVGRDDSTFLSRHVFLRRS